MLRFFSNGGRDSQKKTDVGGDEQGGGGGGITCESVTVLDLQALPEACIANVISLTTPRDACRLAAVSTSFRSASESDAVWDVFLPPEIHTTLSATAAAPLSPKSKKDLYLALCENPVLIHQGKMSFSLDKLTGKKCYMISARNLSIVWAETPHYWRWISQPDSRFEEVAELLSVCWLEIRGKIGIRLLSPSTVYKAYLVFKSSAGAYGFEYQPVEVTVGVVGGGEVSKQSVFLDAERWRNPGYLDAERWRNPGYQIVPMHVGRFTRRRSLEGRPFQPSPERSLDELQYPKERVDGWLEMELGEFFCQGGEDGELEMTCLEVKGGQWKGGLIVQGIELRPKTK